LDLSLARFDADLARPFGVPDVGVLLVGVAARQAASPTAWVQARLTDGAERASRPTLFAPADGAFDGRVAVALGRWARGEAHVYPAASGDVEAAAATPAGEPGEGAPRPDRGHE
jgi:hypothetical protein